MFDVKVSVVMATYNSRRFILEQLDSIVHQTISVDEVVISDDASSDDTVSIIKGYIAQHGLDNWKIIENKSNVGFVQNFNKAISEVTGRIVILCDHDDRWERNKVEVIVNAFKENPNILSLATSFERIDENGVKRPIKLLMGHANNNLIRHTVKKNSLNHVPLKEVAIFNISPGCCCAFSSSIIQSYLKYNTKLPHDWQLNIIASLRNALYYLDVKTTQYRIYTQNTIGLTHQKNREKRLKDCIQNLEEKKAMLKIALEMGTSGDDIQYLESLVDVFERRVGFLKNGFSVKTFLALFVKSVSKNKLWESVLVDAYSLIFNK